MSFLSTKKRRNTGMSDHEYAKRFGWQIKFDLSPKEYVEACEYFESADELNAIALKKIQRAIRFRKSFFGRLLAFLRRKVDQDVRH